MIPVAEPVLTDEDKQSVLAALERGEISGSFGVALKQFEEELAAYVGCKHGIAVSSGTTALHLAVAAAGIGPGDEVLCRRRTNIATALAAYHNGAVPVPVDSEADDLEPRSRPARGADHAEDARDHPGPPLRPPGRHGPLDARSRSARARRHRGLRRVARRDGARPR